MRTRLPILCLAAALVAVLPVLAHADVNFTAELFGQAEVPPVDTDAYGSCLGILSEDELLFTISCEHTLDDAIAAHIHTGFSDESGPVLFNLGDASSPIQAEWALDADDVVRLLAGGLYVNVHTPEHTNGEIRGQLLPAQPIAERTLSFALRGDAVVPPVDTDADGACFVDVDYEFVGLFPPEEVTLNLRCTHDVADATSADLVLGAAGENGTTVIPLNDGESPLETTVVLDTVEEVDAYFEGDWYVLISSDSDPEGELRGQLGGCESSPDTLCLNGNRFAVTIDWATAGDSGVGIARRETIDSGLFWFFRPSNIEVLVKVLDGCGVNDHYWVFLAATTNVGYELRVTDTLSGESVSYDNTLGTFAEPQLDTAAFETCP